MAMQSENFTADTIEEANIWLLEYKNTKDEVTKKKLRDLIVLAYMPLVKKVARGFARRSTDPVEDITQVGSMGLIKAIDLFKSDISSNFKTYATYLITGEIRHYLRDKTTIIRAPREIKELSYRVHKLTLELTERLGCQPTDEQIAQALQMPAEKIEEVIELERRTTTVSIDQIIGSEENGQTPLMDKIADEKDKNLASAFENKMILEDAIKRLSVEDQKIITMNFFEGLNQREISERLNISQMQVSRKLKKSLNKLFELITKKGVTQYD